MKIFGIEEMITSCARVRVAFCCEFPTRPSFIVTLWIRFDDGYRENGSQTFEMSNEVYSVGKRTEKSYSRACQINPQMKRV